LDRLPPDLELYNALLGRLLDPEVTGPERKRLQEVFQDVRGVIPKPRSHQFFRNQLIRDALVHRLEGSDEEST
jgi:hypothetical protein